MGKKRQHKANNFLANCKGTLSSKAHLDLTATNSYANNNGNLPSGQGQQLLGIA